MSRADLPGEKSAEASFLSRWSQRKVEAKKAPIAVPSKEQQNPSIDAPPGTKMPETPLPERNLPAGSGTNEPLPAINTLTHEADFSAFMAKDVDPGLRNQAMKKLFTDPHYTFEQMDKLDIYIDDYSKPDPIPVDMLRMMYQSKSLGLFDDEKSAEPPLPKDTTSGNINSENVADPVSDTEPQLLSEKDVESSEVKVALGPEPDKAVIEFDSKNSP